MTPDIALQQLRNIADGLHASGCHWRSERITESANAIEAAMREPVCTVDDLQFMNLHGTELEPGTKLFAFPPSAQAELVSGAYKLNDALEAAMTQPVAWQNTKWPSIIVTNDALPKYPDEWIPLFAFPPDAAGEIERLTLQRDAQAENATQWFDRANGREIEAKALREALNQAAEALDLAQALLERSSHHPKILEAYKQASAALPRKENKP